MFEIFLTNQAQEQLDRLKTDKGLFKRYKAVKPDKKQITIIAITPHP